MLSTSEILSLRPKKNAVDPHRPNGFFVEPEYSADGTIEQSATILLTGRECAFHCLMCDLWKNTLDEDTPRGAIPRQIDFALAQLPRADVLKLYNSSNFFDPRSVPVEDYGAIAERARRFRRLIVENHPRLCNDRCREFAAMVFPCELEVAIGMETVEEHSLRALNKQMTIEHVERAVENLLANNIHVRAFILLRLPGMDEEQGVYWAVRSIATGFRMGVQVCSVIPMRVGNGALEWLQAQGQFAPPHLRSLELVCERGLSMQRGRVFADLWDIGRLSACTACRAERVERLRQMNLTQRVPPGVECSMCHSNGSVV